MPIPPIAVGKRQMFEQESVIIRTKNGFNVNIEINPTQSTKQTPSHQLNK